MEKADWPDATRPPSVTLRLWTLLFWAILLLPYIARRGVSAASLGALALWCLCLCFMHGKLMTQNLNQTPAMREWENFHGSCGVFGAGLLIIALLSFPFFRENGIFPPLWWLLLLMPLVALHFKFLMRTAPKEEMGQGCWRYVSVFCLVVVCAVSDLGVLAYINGAFDASETRSFQARVTDKQTSSSKQLGTSHNLKFRLSDGRHSAMRVSPNFYVGTYIGQIIEVRTKSGALGAEWIAEVL